MVVSCNISLSPRINPEALEKQSKQLVIKQCHHCQQRSGTAQGMRKVFMAITFDGFETVKCMGFHVVLPIEARFTTESIIFILSIRLLHRNLRFSCNFQLFFNNAANALYYGKLTTC